MDENREYARAELVRGIVGQLHREAPSDHLPLFGAIAKRLIDRVVGTADATPADERADAVFRQQVEDAVAAFTPHASERRMLYATLLEAVTASLTARAHHLWQAYDLGLGAADADGFAIV